MATANGIHGMYSPYAMGDVEKYFVKLDRMIGMNSGINDYSVTTHNCYSTSVPFGAGCFTKFKLTDSGYDIIDISQGYIHLNVSLDVEFDHKLNQIPLCATRYRNYCWFFVGLKSGAQIIDTYKVYSNGRLTACNQVKANHEQAIVFNCKSKDQKNARPGIYSCHENVLKMNDCKCGFYIKQPLGMYYGNKTEVNLTMEIVIQIDDLLPFSGMRYFPAFACGDLELELSFSLEKNFVFCQIPFESVYTARLFDQITLSQIENEIRKNQQALPKLTTTNMEYLAATATESEQIYDAYIDFRFHQCGDYARCLLGMVYDDGSNYTNGDEWGQFRIEPSAMNPDALTDPNMPTTGSFEGNLKCTYLTIIPHNLTIYNAKSFIYGFNIKAETKQNILAIFKQEKKLTIPAQWIEHQIFNQKPGYDSMKMQMNTPLYQVSQMIFTFPNSENQVTVSRNPYLQNVKCQIDNKMIPDKDMSTIEPSCAEMTLVALGFDNYFRASQSLINALNPPYLKDNEQWHECIEDDSDFMFVIDLERNGNGVHHDGYSSDNALITFDANYIGGSANAHYYPITKEANATHNPDVVYPENETPENAAARATYELFTNTKTLKQFSPNLYTVSDAFWVFTPSGGEFIKDARAIALLREREYNIARNHHQ